MRESNIQKNWISLLFFSADLVKLLVATAEYVTASCFSSDHIAVLLGGYTATLSPQGKLSRVVIS